jgi:hypothetical protein
VLGRIRLICALSAGLTPAAAAPAVAVPEGHSAPTQVVLEQVDGGPGWYGRFTDPLPSRPSFFPIAVWFESVVSAGDVRLDNAAGLNTYVVLTADSDMPLVRRSGMRAIVQSSERTRFTGIGAETAGWELMDEIDMTDGPGAGDGRLRDILASLPADGRLRYNNFGKGVLFWQSDADARRFVNAYADLVSADAYWFTDDGICTASEGGRLVNGGARDLSPAECHRAANYGATVTRMRSLVSPAGSRPVWAFVELGHPFTEPDWPTITPAQVRAAVWHSLIAGARGIIYFNHSFGGANETQHILRDPAYGAIRSAVSATNRQIAALAPVLNAPTLRSGWSQGAGTTAMVKWSGRHFYLFAGSAGSRATGTFSIPCVGDATAAVLSEGRAIAVRDGIFADTFADGNAIHLYRIDGGSSCGLTTVAPAPPARARVGRLPRRVGLRSGRLAVPVRCGTPCTARGRLTTRAGSRRRLLAAGTRRFGAGSHRLVLRLRPPARRRLARARRPIVARLRTVIVESDAPGARRTQRLVISRRSPAGGAG